MLLRRIVFRMAIAIGFCLLLPGAVVALQVDPSTRNASLSFYYDAYLPSVNVPLGWTGNHALCDAGTTSLEFRQSVIDRVNYFRAMAGVPAEIDLNDTWSNQAQKAALMMSANNSLNHNPPNTWMCYTTEGAAAAAKSNLALGSNGAASVDAYIKEPGAANTAAGHRRLILYPQTDEMGTGDVPVEFFVANAANALWVIDNSPVSPRPATRDPFVAWPPPGFVPYQVTYPRWSFSFPNANFASASVAMTENGAPVSVALEPLSDGFGENTLVWIPKGHGHSVIWPKPSSDVKYQVTVSNVIVGGTPQSFSYDVNVFDPGVLPGDYTRNGIVDAADYTIWRNSLGQDVTNFSGADGNGDGTISSLDYDVWKGGFGGALPGAAAMAAVPEPTAMLLFLMGLTSIRPRAWRNCRGSYFAPTVPHGGHAGPSTSCTSTTSCTPAAISS